MKTAISIVCLCALSSVGSAQTVSTNSSVQEQVGYSFGYLMGRSNAESVKNLDLDNNYLKAYKDLNLDYIYSIEKFKKCPYDCE